MKSYSQKLAPLLFGVLGLFSTGCRAVPEGSDPPLLLRGESTDYWRAMIRPAEIDLAWTRISWLPTMAEGIKRANLEEKPLLLWLMNGHPLGCT